MAFVHRLRVRYVECDLQGHAFNAHYLTWFDIAHTELWRAAIGPFGTFAERGLDVVVAEAGVRFRSGARFDDEIDLAVTLAPLTTTSMTSRYAVRRGDELLADGEVRHVCVDAETHGAKQPWPDDVRTALAPYVEG